MSDILQKVDQYKRQLVKDLLSQCTDKQIAFFNRMYKSVDDIPDKKIPWAIQQIENTIAKNNFNKMKEEV